MPHASVEHEASTSWRWSALLWSAFWIAWAVRGVSFVVDLGPVGSFVTVASWVAFGAVLVELSVRRLRHRPG